MGEHPFEAVQAVSEFNQRAYELFAQPLVQSLGNAWLALLLRQFHPLRLQRWAISDANPWFSWLGRVAQAVRANRRPVGPEHPLRQFESVGAEMISASLDLYRALRDATTEATFFGIYANLFSMYLADKRQAEHAHAQAAEPSELPYVREALGSIAQGGYAEACARAGALLMNRGEPLPLARLETIDELARDYADYVPNIPHEQLRRLRGEQEINARYEPEQAVLTLPALLRDQADRTRLLTLLDKLITDPRVQAVRPTAGQLEMMQRIRHVLGARPLELEQLNHVRATHAPVFQGRDHVATGIGRAVG
jgi:hypothetical protein